MRATIAAKHLELASGFRTEPEAAAGESAAPLPVPPAMPEPANGPMSEAAKTLAARAKPFLVGSLVGAALGFFAGAHM
jgi:hypothetical protein